MSSEKLRGQCLINPTNSKYSDGRIILDKYVWLDGIFRQQWRTKLPAVKIAHKRRERFSRVETILLTLNLWTRINGILSLLLFYSFIFVRFRSEPDKPKRILILILFNLRRKMMYRCTTRQFSEHGYIFSDQFRVNINIKIKDNLQFIKLSV